MKIKFSLGTCLIMFDSFWCHTEVPRETGHIGSGKSAVNGEFVVSLSKRL